MIKKTITETFGTIRTSKSPSSVTNNSTYLKLIIANCNTYNFSATNGPMTVHQHSFTNLYEVTDNLMSTFQDLIPEVILS
jgi:hypothetical protein